MRAPNGNFAFTVESEISFPIRFHIRIFDAAVTWQIHVTTRGRGSKLSDSKGKLQENFEGNLAVISETRGEASFERGSIWRPFGEEKIRYRELEHA
ncbi:hypothetical protein H5410_057090 [Solanum commersonii]|uniref:Uncharacterized protein n=1 Tax=Solanum commersonii TaxID=4109 RepID=A0A9J5WP51_SOLCO|nr:hypothetical protein H5410_057090 [Solanum commersonii]